MMLAWVAGSCLVLASVALVIGMRAYQREWAQDLRPIPVTAREWRRDLVEAWALGGCALGWSVLMVGDVLRARPGWCYALGVVSGVGSVVAWLMVLL